VAAVLLFRAFHTGEDTSNQQPASSAPLTITKSPSAGAHRSGSKNQSAHKDQRVLLAQSLDPTLRFDLLKGSEDVTYKGTGRDIFRSQAEAVIPTPLPAGKQPKPGPPPTPAPPPIDLKFYGFAGPKNGPKKIFLSKGEDIFLAREGDVVDRRYKILKVNANSVDVEDVLTNNHQTLPLSAG
jgi:hypothetical protein